MAQTLFSSCAGIEVLKWGKGACDWEKSWIRHIKPVDPIQSYSEHTEQAESSDVTIFIMPHQNILKRCGSCVEHLHSSFEFLPTWWELVYFDSNGYFGYEDEFDKKGDILSVSTWSRFLIQHFNASQTLGQPITHQWRDIIAFTHWLKVSKKTQIMFLGTDEPVLKRLLPTILQNLKAMPKSPPGDPLWPYLSIIDNYINLQHTATYAIRDLTESEERRADSSQLKPSTDYARLHQVAKHALTVLEILEVNVKTLDHMLKYHEGYLEHSTSEHKLDDTFRKTQQRLLLYAHMMYSIRCRCLSYRDRMKNQIQLAFNIVSQDHARASVEIAKATKEDSQAMKAISFIALVFLPPTYISAVFSTTFFEFGADSRSWAISEKIWIYFAFVLPMTLASVALWYTYIFKGSVLQLLKKICTRQGSLGT